ncbi:MAG: galactokinase, partial [Candidatus Latescibacterota bacterium]
YGTAPEIVAAAPGRVNLIGEHTDYTGGFVLPVAIDREIVLAAGKTGDGIIRGYSLDYDSEASCGVGHYDPEHPLRWFRYVMGVLKEVEETGQAFGGFQFSMGGNIPIGSGLSSSAALETATLTLMEGLFKFEMEDIPAALLCQRAENRFVGVNCGIMDQLISRAGRRGYALFVDCRDLTMKTVPAVIPGTVWVVVDSRKKRGLVDSEYNRRRRECEEAVQCAQKAFPKRAIQGLRDVEPGDLDTLRTSCPDVVFRRLRHIVTENARVLDMVRALHAGKKDEAGKLLHGSHASLRDDFEVSCEELDTLVDILTSVPGVHGARLTGAGFGGCVIALAERDALPRLEEAVSRGYHPPHIPGGAQVWPIEVSEGARIVS